MSDPAGRTVPVDAELLRRLRGWADMAYGECAFDECAEDIATVDALLAADPVEPQTPINSFCNGD